MLLGNSEALSRKFDLGRDNDVTRSPFAREFLKSGDQKWIPGAHDWPTWRRLFVTGVGCGNPADLRSVHHRNLIQ